MLSHRCLFLLIVCALLAPASLAKEPTAPLTHDKHKQKHNPKHDTEPAKDSPRFHTDRDSKGQTLKLPKQDDAFQFVVFGDRTGGPHSGINVLANAVADTNLLEPDLVMTVGDLINGYADDKVWMPQMKQYKQVMGELICPWFPVAGNHDVYWRGPNKPKNELEPLYEKHFGPLWYAFEHKKCFFIVLYTDEPDPKTGERNFKKPASQKMSDRQFTWLKKTLAKAKDAEHVFVFLHHPRWLGTIKRKSGYGDDWNKVHKELVKAGNISGVFAGHIHHMRYDPKDGIDYFSLATVGGGQSGWSPKAGWLHQFHVVTVRKKQVAFASVPVGGIDDPKAITGKVSEQAELLGRSQPVNYKSKIAFNQDGSVSTELKLTVKNPAKFAIEIEAVPTSRDSRWSIGPDHRHAKIEAGKSIELTFKITRPAGKLDTTIRPIVLKLGIDMLAEKYRYPIPVKRISVPGSLVVKAK